MSDGITSLSAVEIANAIATRRFSAREAVTAHLDRIDQFDARVGAFVEVERPQALAAADVADTAVSRGEPLGPLHGVPMAHKDMFQRPVGRPTGGSLLYADEKPRGVATVIERLDRAGAITVGSLAMVEFAMGPHGYNAHLRRSRNPWNLDHITCGSSSGSGAAVAAGFVAAALGSDTGGSIRCPASANGVVGLLPTYSRVSRFGAMPMSFSLDSIGPLARTARDCARMLGVIAGRDSRDATSSSHQVEDFERGLERSLRGARVGVPDSYFDQGTSADVAANIEEALRVFSSLGVDVVPVRIPASLQSAADLHPLLMKAEGAANHHNWMRSAPEKYTDEVRHRLQAGFFVPAADYLQALKLRAALLEEFVASVFEQTDVLITPVLPKAAPSIAETAGKDGPAYLEMVLSLTRNTKVFNFLGLPAISVPNGFTGTGLPTSFQLAGRPFSESLLLRVGHQYQQATNWWSNSPKQPGETSGLPLVGKPVS